MAERLYQVRFDERFILTPQDVTPPHFAGLPFPRRDHGALATDLGRFLHEVAPPSVQVISPGIAARYLLDHVFTPFDRFDQEETWVLLLNTKNTITHEAMVYRGTVNAAIIRPAELLKPAVQVNAPAIILTHNHPSADPSQSPEDVAVTRSVYEAGRLLGIELLDHIIVGRNCYVSLKEKGLGFDP